MTPEQLLARLEAATTGAGEGDYNINQYMVEAIKVIQELLDENADLKNQIADLEGGKTS